MIRLLTAIDASRGSTHAIHVSCRLAQHGPAVHDILPLVDPRNATDRATLDQWIAAAARETGAAPRVLTENRVVDRRRLARLARDYDLCIIGTHDGLRIADFVLGDRMVRLARAIETPVLVVRDKLDVRRILWRIPFAPVEARHKRCMCQLLNLTQASVSLFLARPRTSMYAFDRDEADHDPVRRSDELGFIGEIRERIHAQTGQLPDHVIRTGIPEEVLLAEAESGFYDLIAVSARARRGVGRLFADDLPYNVALHAPISVLILR